MSGITELLEKPSWDTLLRNGRTIFYLKSNSKSRYLLAAKYCKRRQTLIYSLLKKCS